MRTTSKTQKRSSFQEIAFAESPSREAAIKAVMLAKKVNTKIIFDIDYREYNWKNADEISIYYSIVAKEGHHCGPREESELTEKLIKEGMTDEESAAYWQSKNAKDRCDQTWYERLHSIHPSTDRNSASSHSRLEARKGRGGDDMAWILYVFTSDGDHRLSGVLGLVRHP